MIRVYNIFASILCLIFIVGIVKNTYVKKIELKKPSNTQSSKTTNVRSGSKITEEVPSDIMTEQTKYLFDGISSVSGVYLKLYKKEIIESSIRWNVPAVAIAGIICVESTLNYDGAQRLEDYYFKKIILKKSKEEIAKLIEEARVASVFQKRESFFVKINNPIRWSLGLCQISLPVALKADSSMAIQQNRSKLSEKDLIDAVLNPKTNIDYCGFYLGQIMYEYKNRLGIDLSKRPSLLVTIYNLGNIDKLINQRKSDYKVNINTLNNNRFGQFVEKYESKIYSLLLSDK